MRAMQWRAAVFIVGIGLVFAWVWASGGTTHLITIDYSWAGELLDGADVYFNGEIVGQLEPYGRSTRATGFEVEPGTYMVKVVHESCPGGREYQAVLGGDAGRRKLFMADMEDGYSCRVVLR